MHFHCRVEEAVLAGSDFSIIRNRSSLVALFNIDANMLREGHPTWPMPSFSLVTPLRLNKKSCLYVGCTNEEEPGLLKDSYLHVDPTCKQKPLLFRCSVVTIKNPSLKEKG